MARFVVSTRAAVVPLPLSQMTKALFDGLRFSVVLVPLHRCELFSNSLGKLMEAADKDRGIGQLSGATST